MRCERCKFENIPGQKTCVKCGSILEIRTRAIDVHPPRMANWKKSFREMARLMRQIYIAPRQNDNRFHFQTRIKEILNDDFVGLIISIIPGLAHLIKGRFNEIRWYFWGWLVSLLLALFLYSSLAGFILLGLSIAVHGAIGLRYGIMQTLTNAREKIVTVILVLIALTVIYRFIPHLIFPALAGGYSSVTIPHDNIITGDYILAWRNVDKGIQLPRGSLVMVHPAYYNGHNRIVTRSGDLALGEIVGLAGEEVQIAGGAYIINGKELDKEKYPVPEWLRNVNFSIMVPEKSYFVSMRYNLTAYGMALNNSDIRNICITTADDIEAKAFMRWWPLSRRGFIRNVE